jgi:hypothetical protein
MISSFCDDIIGKKDAVELATLISKKKLKKKKSWKLPFKEQRR